MQEAIESKNEAIETVASGILEITDKGYGFLRQAKNDYKPTPGDVFVSKDFIRHGGLRTGATVKTPTGSPSITSTRC